MVRGVHVCACVFVGGQTRQQASALILYLSDCDRSAVTAAAVASDGRPNCRHQYSIAPQRTSSGDVAHQTLSQTVSLLLDRTIASGSLPT